MTGEPPTGQRAPEPAAHRRLTGFEHRPDPGHDAVSIGSVGSGRRLTRVADVLAGSVMRRDARPKMLALSQRVLDELTNVLVRGPIQHLRAVAPRGHQSRHAQLR